jgi:hypothetical protein
MASKAVRIGCASGFYGDSQLSARQLVEKGDIDYLVFDYLAEVTMAILSRAQAQDERLGYAVDFVTVAMKDVLRDCAASGIKVVANAGGVNVPACISALEALCSELDISLTVAGVYGDDLSDRADDLAACGMPELQTGKALPDKLASINAYLGARPIADALAAGADVVVTGLVVDSAVVLGPLMHEFGWSDSDYDQLAQGSLVGHVIECGAQCTGGNFTDWQLVSDFSNIGYPVAEVVADGSFTIEIPPGTSGVVIPGSVGEQILYEIGDPANYLLPDVACDFSLVQLEQVAQNKVRVSGARGRSPGPQYKVCATYVDGYRLMGSFFISGLRAADKARCDMDAWIKRTRRYFAGHGIADYRQVSLEVIGAEDTYGPHARALDTREVMGKYGLHHDNPAALKFAAAELAYLATSGPPAMSGFGAGRARPQPLMVVHSALIDKDQVPVTVQLGDTVLFEQCYLTPALSTATAKYQMQIAPCDHQGDWIEVPLEQLAYARSGDKGNNANIGIIARKPEYLSLLSEQLTAQAVDDYFAHLVEGDVERFEVPGLNAFNFLMTEALGGGGTASVRVDAQGKAYGQMLLSMAIKVPAPWFAPQTAAVT